MQPTDLPAPVNRLSCPNCGNDNDFYEIAEDAVITTHYIQNQDGSFTPLEDDSQVHGDIKLICGQCQADLSIFYQRFSEMLF
ncbi:MAG: hypothetical protein KKD01_00280 [Proteobacteria bacterium]|nr:hypothetical protein [Pseudomonadota bacterium]MBU1137338.1 hypothetical protein [Pseudomonadota bacterium]MBU1234175.1 hypothetical protein [Pseudomonadota bacterium]MBU1417444.1 hypothetical protein [Pseudomonadota bacterium]MBU1453133.1 hypothetical protein [Pseudomonadota bacterium]